MAGLRFILSNFAVYFDIDFHEYFMQTNSYSKYLDLVILCFLSPDLTIKMVSF